MNKLIRQVTKVVKALNQNKAIFVSEDNCEGSPDYLEVEGREVVVEDDGEGSWSATLDKISGAVDLGALLIAALGRPSKVHEPREVGGMKSRRVLNWEPVKNVLIVYIDDPKRPRVEFTQYYSKR